MIKTKNFKKYTFMLFVTLFLLSFLKVDYRLKEINPGAISDDSAYYYHAQTIGEDLDLDYSNQLRGTDKRNLNLENGKPVPVHPIGAGVLASPFVFISNIISSFINLDSVVSLNYFIYSFASIFYLFAGIFMINIILKDKVENYNPLLSYLLILGSGLSYYAFERFSMSHAYEFFGMAFIFYLTYLYSKKNFLFLEFIISFSMLFLLTIRWSNYHIFLIPAIYSIVFETSKKFNLYKKPLFYLGFALGILIFLIHTKFLYGIYTFNPSDIFLLVENRLSSSYESLLDFSRLSENILLSLRTLFLLFFSSEFGLFFFSPIVFSGFIFILFFIFQKKFLLSALIGVSHLMPFLAVLVFQNTSYSYGFRYMFSLICLNIILYFKFFHEKKVIRYYIVIFSLFGILSLMMFEVSEFTVLSTSYVENSFGQDTLYANPDYLNGVFKSLIRFDSFLNIIFTSFLGVLILKILGIFVDPYIFVSRFKTIDSDIELLLYNSDNLSWTFILISILSIQLIVKILSKDIKKNNFYLLRKT